MGHGSSTIELSSCSLEILSTEQPSEPAATPEEPFGGLALPRVSARLTLEYGQGSGVPLKNVFLINQLSALEWKQVAYAIGTGGNATGEANRDRGKNLFSLEYTVTSDRLVLKYGSDRENLNQLSLPLDHAKQLADEILRRFP